MKHKLGFEFRLLAAFTAALVVVASLAASAWKQIHDASEITAQAMRAQALLNQLSHIRTQTVLIELSTQNFRISGDSTRLAERDASIARRDGLMQQLGRSLANEPDQLVRWNSLNEVIEQRLRISRQVEHLRKTQGVEAANAYVATAPLKATRDRVHSLLSEMEAVEEGALAQRSQDQKASHLRTHWAEAMLTALLLALFVLTYFVMRHQVRSLEASRRALADSEDSLATTLHSIGDGVIATDTNGRIIQMNPVAENLTGWPLALARGRMIGEVLVTINQQTRQLVEVPVDKVLATGEASDLSSHTALVRRDGTECPIADTAAPIRHPSGQVRGVVIVFRDDTHNRQARLTVAEQNARLQQRVEERTQQLRESQDHLTNVINSVPALIAYVDAQQRYVYVNAQYQARFAPDKADITGQSVSEILGEDRYRVASPMIDKVLQGQPQSYDWEPFPGVWQVIHYLPKLDEQGAVAGYYVLGTDVTERKAHERELARVANYDPLTQLPNRRLLSDRLNQMILHAQRSEKIGAICFLDLDGFKLINDQHGHEVGDQLLVGVARNLTSALRAHDTLARLGGDEFVLLLSDLDSPHECAVILSRVLQTVRQPVNAGGHVISISASIGVTLYPHDSADPDTLLRHADQTMYLAKQAGKNRYQLFDPEVDRKTQSRHELLAQMRTALANGEFVLFYQPKVDLVGGDVVGAEALIRWQHPQRGLLPPGEFLPHLSGTDVEWLFGEWVLATALQQMQTWARAGMVMKVSVNISASHLLHAGFHEHLAHVLLQHPGVAAGDLELEVLETAAIEDIQLAQNVMRRCMELGVRFSLDDFGTGYSSLTYLRKLPIHAIKIDQSFVRDMLVDPEDMSIVLSVIQLARAFHRQVVAEGVETLAHGSHLLAMGCHLAQGYGIARPMPADQLMAWRIQWLAAGAWRRDLQPVDGFPR